MKDSHAAPLRRESPEVQKNVKKLYDYYSTQWMGIVYPEKFSVYRDHDRTNNAVESWNRRFNRLCGVAHGNWWNHHSKNLLFYSLHIII